MPYRIPIVLALLAIQIGWLQFSWISAIGVTVGIYLAAGGWRFVRLLLLTFPRDFRFVNLFYGLMVM